MFTCKTCPAGSDTHANDYTNRLSCYPCDYDMCRQCVADRWGPEALGITGGDHCGFGRSAVIERQHRCVCVCVCVCVSQSLYTGLIQKMLLDPQSK